MPRGDQTGPIGRGPMTGWGAGYCAGFERPGVVGLRGRGGRGRGRNGGRAWSSDYWFSSPSPQDEASHLKAHSERLKKQLEAIETRLAELKNKH